MTSYCFMIQPFGGRHDKLYEEVFAPAVRDAGLEPYRIDRDLAATVLIEDIERKIRGASVCLADISEDNANVWFELGFALASSVHVCMVCDATGRDSFPFDVRHRHIIRYNRESPKDFSLLQEQISGRISAVLKTNTQLEMLAADVESRTQTGSDLTDLDLACLVVIASETGGPDALISAWQVSNGMEKAGYNALGSALGLRRLSRMGLISSNKETNMNGEVYIEHGITAQGWDTLEASMDKVSLKAQPKGVRKLKSNFDDDIPF